MSIDNVESTLPDQAWVLAAERKISALEARIERLEQDALAARR